MTVGGGGGGGGRGYDTTAFIFQVQEQTRNLILMVLERRNEKI